MYRKIVELHELGEREKNQMLCLMGQFYDDVSPEAFYNDLMDKSHCILLYDDADEIKGFSTQKIMSLKLKEKTIHGVFSGDTIIHKEHWGSLELYKAFSEKFIEYGRQFEEFYWFLISKGYKTYKMLPLFFYEFYPNYKRSTPEYEQSIIHTFGKTKYPQEYNEKTGVIEYCSIKDKLKKGVADIGQKDLRDKNIQFFMKRNPGYIHGDDIVCLADLKESNIRKTALRLFLGR